MEAVPVEKRDEVQGDLFDLPEKAAIASDTPLSWIKSTHIVDLWGKRNSYDTRDINFTLLPTGELVVSLLDGERITIPAPDPLGKVPCKDGRKMPMQQAIDRVYAYLINRRPDQRYLWDLREVKKWGQAPATESQLKYVRRVLKDKTPDNLTKGEAVPESPVRAEEATRNYKKEGESMTDENRLILAMKAGASALENHKAAESMSFFIRGGECGKPDATIAYLDAAKILREEAARLAADDSAVDNIRCPHCGELFDGGEATNYDVSCAHVECPYCGQPAYIAQSVTYTASAE